MLLIYMQVGEPAVGVGSVVVPLFPLALFEVELQLVAWQDYSTLPLKVRMLSHPAPAPDMLQRSPDSNPFPLYRSIFMGLRGSGRGRGTTLYQLASCRTPLLL